ncbi:MAG: hypothetical protein OXP71_05705 [Candidatus Poribacteria bacterium]|nr:hypothetical protein [Candidatus Poribacteria bacterium]
MEVIRFHAKVTAHGVCLLLCAGQDAPPTGEENETTESDILGLDDEPTAAYESTLFYYGIELGINLCYNKNIVQQRTPSEICWKLAHIIQRGRTDGDIAADSGG